MYIPQPYDNGNWTYAELEEQRIKNMESDKIWERILQEI